VPELPRKRSRNASLGELSEGFADPDHPWRAAVRQGHRIVTADTDHFRRIGGLKLVGYR
jgi:hypothetical protein